MNPPDPVYHSAGCCRADYKGSVLQVVRQARAKQEFLLLGHPYGITFPVERLDADS